MSITATDEDPDEAIRIADAFGAELIAYLEAEDAARRRGHGGGRRAAEALQTRITDLEALIAQNPANVAVLSAERDALVRQYSVVFEDQNEGVAPNRYSTIEAATAVRADEGRFAPPSSAGQRMLLAGLVALILGGALALFIDRADNRIRTRRHAEAAFGLPVIAEIPAISGRAGRRGVVVADNPGSQVAEAFRTLRTSAQLFARSGPTEADQPGLAGRRVLVTSTDAGEGKSTTAANLAAAFAETGRSVLLIDWDLSRPALGHLMRTETSRGVADVLVPVAEAPALPTCACRPASPGLAPRRRHVDSAHGQSGRVGVAVLDEARRFADVVVVDTPPLLGSSITRELVTLAEAVIVVCRSGATGEGSASRASDLLSRLGAQVIGIALVGISAPCTTSTARGSSVVGRRRRRRQRQHHERQREDLNPLAGEDPEVADGREREREDERVEHGHGHVGPADDIGRQGHQPADRQHRDHGDHEPFEDAAQRLGVAGLPQERPEQHADGGSPAPRERVGATGRELGAAGVGLALGALEHRLDRLRVDVVEVEEVGHLGEHHGADPQEDEEPEQLAEGAER